MIINSMKNGQFFTKAFTTENKGIISLDILPTARVIDVTKAGAAISGKDSGFTAVAGDWAFPTVKVGGAAGVIVPTKKELGLISFSTDIIKLGAGKVTKSAGLEIDFAGFPMPQVGDAISLMPEKRLVGDDYLVDRTLFVISISGTKVKVMKEVPSAMAIDSTSPISAVVHSLSKRNASLKHGIDVTSVTRNGEIVSLVGSHSKLIGIEGALGGITINDNSKLLVAAKRKAGQKRQYSIISMSEGVIKVIDRNNEIAVTPISTKILDTVDVVAIGGFTLISAMTMHSSNKNSTISIDLNKLTGAAVGDVFNIEARYGGNF